MRGTDAAECHYCRGPLKRSYPGGPAQKYCSEKCRNNNRARKKRLANKDGEPLSSQYHEREVTPEQDLAFQRAMMAAGYKQSEPVRDYTPTRLTPLGAFAPVHVRQHATLWPSTGEE